MKATCYLRIGKKERWRWGEPPFAFAVTGKSSSRPINDPSGEPLPTVLVKLNLELPDDLFGPVAELDVEVPDGAVLLSIEAHDA